MNTSQHSATTEQPEAAIPQVPIRPKRIRLLVVGGVVVAVVAAGLVAARMAATGGDQGKLTDTGIASCAVYIAEGVVTGVSPSGGPGRRQVTIQVEASLKGAEAGRPLTYGADEASAAQATPGTRVFVVVSRFSSEPAMQYIGADIAWARDWMASAVPRSHNVPCDGPG